jgi:hypothetical protein
MTEIRFLLASFVSALALLLPTDVSGQTAPLVLGLPGSTEALSLGNVFPVSGRDPDAVFYNAGALAGAEGIGIAAQRLGSSSVLLGASGAADWFGGTVGIGLQTLSYDAGQTGQPPSAEDLRTDGQVGVSEMAVSVGYGRELGALRLGAAAKVLQERIGTGRGSAAALDLGATGELSFLTLGLAIQNIGSDLEVGDLELDMPETITLSASFEPEPVGPLDVRAAGALARRSDGELIPGAGVDVRFWPVQGRTFIARAGLQRVPEGPASPVTFGLAFWGDALAVEYAFRAYDDSDDSHRLGLRWRR